MSAAYYNENDPKAASWLRELIKAGLIAPGIVDERSVLDVNPYELTQYTQHHFFAGIGGWSYALRLAGWPDDKPVVTGSCPCQPFSAAGKRLGVKDDRHLWPVFRDIIANLEPTVAFGEQVASADGREWLAGVRSDLEALGYAVGAADLCAAGVLAPHPRQRLYWVADAYLPHKNRRTSGREQSLHDEGRRDTEATKRVEYTEGNGRIKWWAESNWWGTSARLGNDGFWRRIAPYVEPVPPRLPGRMDLLRGYGNAIVPQVAAEFIQAATEALTP